MYKPATIKDIALALKLSPSTVSRALRDGYEISAATKKIVAEYAKSVNYKSNPNALSLKNKRSYSIGIVVPELANSFFSQAIAGIESIAYEKGYHTIITQTHDSSERELINVNHLANRSVDGLLISMSSGTADYAFLQKLHQDGLPIVFFDRIIAEIDTFKVTSDNFNASYEATLSLIAAGCTKIAVLANAPQLSITNERFAGYQKALVENDIPFRPELIRNCLKGGSDNQEVEEAVKELLSGMDKPDAIFITSDRISISCIRALKKLKFDPQKIRVLGFSNSDVVDLLQPGLSYVRQKAFEMGEIAVSMLLKLIESKYPITEFETRKLSTELYSLTPPL
ncbi:LacI family DNA-binding transcriptional regulator [Mucilaginibacter sp. ZT4R22]|uniref:LacI family DNA-binding transcriptional regulator n=1 Tax=Mucilaginibacter pankratovii TaxID=2772110 RepID=A0ABR7WM85_9SPHI|nr:LacI family DNA-binding transcriptional regulator [Mucilaginibacter pankratovii]MBD1362432.1 LacI family DNA-binding transcriptional regulator [Mucilaginibacter pankratovii]